MMYVIFEKKTNYVYDFKADPSAFLGDNKYDFDKVTTKEMHYCYDKMAIDMICFYNKAEKAWSFEEKTKTPEQKSDEALDLIRDYTIYTVEPLSIKIDEEILIRLNADLDLCADIVVAQGEIEVDVPDIDYI